jgi:signal transduction histidine kinase
MVVHNRLLQTLSDIFNDRRSLDDRINAEVKKQKTTRQESSELVRLAELKAKTEWFAAIAALENLLLSIPNSPQNEREKYLGLILCSPAPVLSNRELVSRFPTGVFTAEAFDTLTLIPHQLPAAETEQTPIVNDPIVELPLLPNDPISKEAFCLVFTADFALAILLGKDADNIPIFHFSFEPEIIAKIWSTLRSRLLLTNYQHLDRLDLLVNQFTPPEPDYRLVSNFNRQLLKNLPNLATLILEKNTRSDTLHTKQPQHQTASKTTANFHNLHSQQVSLNNKIDSLLEMELLQALTHEIRTPLTTIRTLTRLLLRRKEFTSEVIKRLESIDRECTEQIDRMELIFKAAELETMTRHSVDFASNSSNESVSRQTELVPIALEETFQRIVPCWEKQAQRRNISLDVFLPKKLPKVVSDPAMLDRVLTGLMENIIKSLPCEGKIGVQVTIAGDRLKLQFTSQCPYPANPFKSLGRLLMFQPETGSLSLNLQVTKNLFNALGGKLIVKQRSSHGEVLTIFLPLGNPQAYQVKNN